jgi:hypothetical protein
MTPDQATARADAAQARCSKALENLRYEMLKTLANLERANWLLTHPQPARVWACEQDVDSWRSEQCAMDADAAHNAEAQERREGIIL